MMSFDSSRRSVVHSTKGIVACTQPLAASAGCKILELGGNSMDASIAVSACLCVLEPASTGVAGDCFLLLFENKNNKIYGVNGTGRSPSKLNIDFLKEELDVDPFPTRLPFESVHTVTVPGAIAGWMDALEKYGSGRVTLQQILQPAIDLCELGHPISEVSASLTQMSWSKLLKQNKHNSDLLECFAPAGEPTNPPKEGEIVINKPLAKVFKSILEKQGKLGFYSGEVADAIVDEVELRGGLLSHEDLLKHTTTFVEPISIEFLGHRLWEIPPNSQGIASLIALGIIRELHEEGTIDVHKLEHNSVEYLHLLIECLKIAFYDSDEYVSDPEYQDAKVLPLLLSKNYLKSRARFYNMHGVLDSKTMKHGVPDTDFNQSDTVYFTVSDPEGNVTSFINSVYTNFGSGIIPRKMGGFTLHNRGANFNLTPGTKNSLESNKRPYHTIIPALITDALTGELAYSMGNMGGFMQPTGHLQHFFNLVLFGSSPQQSLDFPRICLSPHPDFKHLDRGLGSGGPVSTPVTLVSVEEDIPLQVVDGLRSLGHDVQVVSGMDRALFGRGQIIRKRKLPNGGVLYSAGSDKRGDGCATPLV